MKVMVFGGSGVGKTTLASEVAVRVGFKHLDSDDYYWKQTRPTFQGKRSFFSRNRKIKVDFKKYDDVIISGCMMTWGKEWHSAFDMAVFIRLENELRLARLRKREIQRYGKALKHDNKVKENSKLFLEWAKLYENPNYKGNTLFSHEKWMKSCNSQVLRLDGRHSLKSNMLKVINEIEKLRETVCKK